MTQNPAQLHHNVETCSTTVRCNSIQVKPSILHLLYNIDLTWSRTMQIFIPVQEAPGAAISTHGVSNFSLNAACYSCWRPCGLCCPLWDGFVAASAVVCGTVGEEPVDDQAEDREEEDEQAPSKFVRDWSIRLENLDCKTR